MVSGEIFDHSFNLIFAIEIFQSKVLLSFLEKDCSDLALYCESYVDFFDKNDNR